MRYLAMAVILLSAGGCAVNAKDRETPHAKYSLTVSGSSMFLLDDETGETWTFSGTGWSRLAAPIATSRP